MITTSDALTPLIAVRWIIYGVVVNLTKCTVTKTQLIQELRHQLSEACARFRSYLEAVVMSVQGGFVW